MPCEEFKNLFKKCFANLCFFLTEPVFQLPQAVYELDQRIKVLITPFTLLILQSIHSSDLECFLTQRTRKVLRLSNKFEVWVSLVYNRSTLRCLCSAFLFDF